MKRSKIIAVIGIIASFLFSTPVMAQLGGFGLSNPNLFRRDGSSIHFQNSTWEFGSSTEKIAGGYFTNLTAGTLTVSSLATSPLAVGGSATSTIYGNGTASVLGGGLRVADGSTTTPAYSFSSETNMGIFRTASGFLGFTDGGNLLGGFRSGTGFFINAGNALQFTASLSDLSAADLYLGRLGAQSMRIGNGPGATPLANTLTIGEASRPGTDSNVGGANGVIRSGLGTGTGTASTLSFQTPDLAASGTGTQTYTTKMTILGNGNVGIGTTAPGYPLEVNGSIKITGIGLGINPSGTYKYLQSGGIMRIQDSGRLEVDSNNNDALKIVNGATTYLQVDTVSSGGVGTYFPNGNVGIGTTAPSSTLHVVGNVQLSASSTVTTASIGGGALLAGACASATSTIDTTVTSSTAAFVTTPQNYPGAGFDWHSYLSASGVLTTEICAEVAATPTATPFNVKIIK